MIEEFFRAAQEGDLAALDEHPELVNIRRDGATALHLAAIDGQLESARWLLEHGAMLDAHDDEFGMSPAAWANEKGQAAMVDFLLAQGASIAPFEAVAFGKLDRLQAFVAADPAVLTSEHEWGGMLHTACIWGQYEILDWLISQGANLTLRSQQGHTPLDIAERQAANGRSHTPIVTDQRKAELERDCARIADRLRRELHAT
jgi:ankyrin repeat protein